MHWANCTVQTEVTAWGSIWYTISNLPCVADCYIYLCYWTKSISSTHECTYPSTFLNALFRAQQLWEKIDQLLQSKKCQWLTHSNLPLAENENIIREVTTNVVYLTGHEKSDSFGTVSHYRWHFILTCQMFIYFFSQDLLTVYKWRFHKELTIKTSIFKWWKKAAKEFKK